MIVPCPIQTVGIPFRGATLSYWPSIRLHKGWGDMCRVTDPHGLPLSLNSQNCKTPKKTFGAKKKKALVLNFFKILPSVHTHLWVRNTTQQRLLCSLPLPVAFDQAQHKDARHLWVAEGPRQSSLAVQPSTSAVGTSPSPLAVPPEGIQQLRFGSKVNQPQLITTDTDL